MYSVATIKLQVFKIRLQKKPVYANVIKFGVLQFLNTRIWFMQKEIQLASKWIMTETCTFWTMPFHLNSSSEVLSFSEQAALTHLNTCINDAQIKFVTKRAISVIFSHYLALSTACIVSDENR